jgi:serine/arginine repetitive matrix protein 2
MYNGIGLATARGSGTNGYVQKNKSYVRPKPKINYDPLEFKQKEPNREILLHEKKRKIEIAILELYDSLEGTLPPDEIDRLCNERRGVLLDEMESSQHQFEQLKEFQTHQLAYQKQLANDRFAKAIGVEVLAIKLAPTRPFKRVK